MGQYLIGIDEGTMSCKTCVFDLEGTALAVSSREYPCYSPRPGYVEQDIGEIRDKVFASCREAIARAGIDSREILGVGFSNQGITHVLVDGDGRHLRDRTIGWQDVRHAEMLPALRARISEEEYFHRSGVPLGAYNTSVLNWLQKYEPGMWSSVATCCSHQDYFLRQLGADGYFIDEASANFTGMLGLEDNEWDEKLVGLYGLRKEQLPTVVHRAGQVVGTVSEAVSKQTGLPAGCPICVGALDVNCCTLATGGVKSGIATMIVGTAGVSTLVCDGVSRDPRRSITIRANHGMPNHVLFAMTHTAASSFRWYRDALCALEVAVGTLLNDDPYNIMTRISANSRPGANGVTALVCFQGVHVHRNNDYAKGTFLGISLGTTKADLAQALLEGICFEMHAILRMKETLAGQVDVVRLCGGVAKSPYWCQMFADIMQKPVELMTATELGSLGAAMYAGVGVGAYADCAGAADRCVHIARTHLPDRGKAGVYAEAYERWRRAYDTVLSFYGPGGD